MIAQIKNHLPEDHLWQDQIIWYEVTDSTNNQAKILVQQGAPHGTVLIADQQTCGRGRLGRSFQSLGGMGVYMSVILRLQVPVDQLMHLTCAAGVAMMQAVEAVSGIRPQMKWINDLVVDRKKLGGILTEMSVDKGLVDYAVVGIGINCLQQPEDFPPEIAGLATSLSLAAGHPITPAKLAAAMVEALWKMDRTLFSEKAQLMAEYKENCITLGKEIQVIRQEQIRRGKALDLDAEGGLLVQYEDGSIETVSSGEVSVRGMYGYL